jgi:glycosyltransferase 2 family protein
MHTSPLHLPLPGEGLSLDVEADSLAVPPDADEPKYRPVVLLLRSVLGLFAGVLVAVLAGWFFGVKPGDVARYVSGVSPWAVLGCVASAFVVLALQSLRWHQVMGPVLGLRYRDAYKAQIVGVLFNALLPMRGGDLLRVQYLGRRTGKSRAIILGTEIVDRWLDWWGWIPTFLVLVVVSHPPAWLFKALQLFGGLLFAWGVGMVLLTRRGWQPSEDSTLGKLLAALRTGVEAFRRPRVWMTALLIAPLSWLWEATALTFAGRAFGIDLSLVQAFSVMIGFNLATIVPAPGAIGTIEAGGTAALQFFGFSPDKALAFMFVYHFSQLLPGMAGGAAVLVFDGERMFGPLATATTPATSLGPAPAAVPVTIATPADPTRTIP